ncbi:MAG: hypothetical protein U9R27_01575 [Campylobacterota bacterium]|nr:hypothetical protein [Campylobacterota bacterium]
MQLSVDIQDNNIAEKILWFLSTFSDKGVKVEKVVPSKVYDDEEIDEEYLEKNWRELVVTSVDSSDYYKSEQYYADRVKDCKSRDKI